MSPLLLCMVLFLGSLTCSSPVQASASSSSTVSNGPFPFPSTRRSASRRSLHPWDHPLWGSSHYSTVIEASSRSVSRRRGFQPPQGVTAVQLTSAAAPSPSTTESVLFPNGDSTDGVPDIGFQDLTFTGKLVAGLTELALVVLFDYTSGFVSGYGLGSVFGLPGLVLGNKKAEMVQTFGQRLATWHGRNARWGSTWASFSAVIGGANVGARVLRNGKEDEWTSILSSMAMGAFWARNEGPAGMARGAIMYGGIVLLFNGGLGGSRRSNRSNRGMPTQEEEQAYADL